MSTISGAFLLSTSHIVQELSDVRTDHRVRNFGDHKILLSVSAFLHFHFSADFNLSDTFFVDRQQVILIDDNTAGREIRSFDVFHQTFDGDVVVFHVGLDRIHNLTQVVRRNACCHTDSDTVCAIQQKVRHAHRQNRRLFFRLVEVRYEIDNVFVEIL